MVGHRPNQRIAVALSFAASLLLVGQQSAFADTIYLKNGRVITTPRAEVQGDQLVFLQYGGQVRIPMALVERVVRDDKQDQHAIVEPPQERRAHEERAAPAERTEGATEESGDASKAAAGGAEGKETEVPPEQTPEFWQERIRTILQEKAELEARMPQLRREERAFLFSHRSTAETRREIEAVQQRLRELDEEMTALRREARRKGIPPGWLRVRQQG